MLLLSLARLAPRRRRFRASRLRTLVGPSGRAAGAQARHVAYPAWLRVFQGWSRPALAQRARCWWARGGCVGRWARALYFRVHRGRRWRVIWVSVWHLGRSWGAFASPRGRVAYRRRILAKKVERREKQAKRQAVRKVYVRPGSQVGRPRKRTARERAARARAAVLAVE